MSRNIKCNCKRSRNNLNYNEITFSSISCYLLLLSSQSSTAEINAVRIIAADYRGRIYCMSPMAHILWGWSPWGPWCLRLCGQYCLQVWIQS